ncbi:excisionase [Lactonifactor sp. BIOML-A4]|uniref:excisionase n=1 Tax=unclassified Lactonifactor TaxID=2636670 RepID=UPI00325A46C4
MFNIGKIEIPVWEKVNLTLEEAAALFNIGVNKLDNLTRDPSCNFVIWKGTHRLIKRKQFEEFNDKLQAL